MRFLSHYLVLRDELSLLNSFLLQFLRFFGLPKMLLFLLFFFHLLLDLFENTLLLLRDSCLLIALCLDFLMLSLCRIKSQELIEIRLVTKLSQCLMVVVLVRLMVVVLVQMLVLMHCFRC
jgi:hypothetical protein